MTKKKFKYKKGNKEKNENTFRLIFKLQVTNYGF